jgi:hypothetical protein
VGQPVEHDLDWGAALGAALLHALAHAPDLLAELSDSFAGPSDVFGRLQNTLANDFTVPFPRGSTPSSFGLDVCRAIRRPPATPAAAAPVAIAGVFNFVATSPTALPAFEVASATECSASRAVRFTVCCTFCAVPFPLRCDRD